MKSPLVFNIPAGARVCGIDVPAGPSTAERIVAHINASGVPVAARLVAPSRIEVDTTKRIGGGVVPKRKSRRR